MSKKDINKMLDIWLEAYDKSEGMNIYNREVCKQLRDAGFSITQLQDQIASIKIKSRKKPGKDGKEVKLTPTETKVLEQYINLDTESDICRNDALVENFQGVKFLQSAERGYSEKTSVDMTANVNLMDVISENSKNR